MGIFKNTDFSDLRNSIEILVREEGISLEIKKAALDFLDGVSHYSVPTPRLFTHGPNSIVFTWQYGKVLVYATVTAKEVSVLISTPEKVEFRSTLSFDEDGSLKIKNAK